MVQCSEHCSGVVDHAPGAPVVCPIVCNQHSCFLNTAYLSSVFPDAVNAVVPDLVSVMLIPSP